MGRDKHGASGHARNLLNVQDRLFEEYLPIKLCMIDIGRILLFFLDDL